MSATSFSVVTFPAPVGTRTEILSPAAKLINTVLICLSSFLPMGYKIAFVYQWVTKLHLFTNGLQNCICLQT